MVVRGLRIRSTLLALGLALTSSIGEKLDAANGCSLPPAVDANILTVLPYRRGGWRCAMLSAGIRASTYFLGAIKRMNY